MKAFLKNHLLKIIIIFAIIAIDLVTKSIFDGKNLSFIEGFIGIESTHNFGAGFSILYGKTILLIIITAIFLLGIIIYDYMLGYKTIWYKLSIAFIIGGAVGNMIDRIFLGYVRDFIKTEFISFPTFNLADSFLTVGVIILAIVIVFSKSPDKHKKTGEITEKTEIEMQNIDSNLSKTNNKNGGKNGRTPAHKKLNEKNKKQIERIEKQYKKIVEEEDEINKF